MVSIISTATDTVLATIPRRPSADSLDGWTVLFTVMGVLLSGFAVGYGLVRWRRTGDAIPLMFMAGGLMAASYEPLLDMAAGVWYPDRGGWIAYVAAGTRVPLWVPIHYIWIIGGQAYVCWRAFERRASPATVWKVFAYVAVSDIVIESIGILLGVYGYYGPQPLNVWGFPLWWPIVNAAAPMFGGALFFVLRGRISPKQQWWMLPLAVPIGWAMTCSGAGYPVWMALHSDWPLWASHVASVFTLLFCYWIVALCRVLCRTPGAFVESPTEDRVVRERVQ